MSRTPPRPGDRLRALAARVCSPHAMERLIDPLIADLQCEHDAARRDGRIWHSRAIRIAGCLSFVKALALYGGHEAMHALQQPWSTREGIDDGDRRVIVRALALSAAAIAIVTVLFLLPPLLSVPPAHVTPRQALWLALFVVPQALPLAIPIGVALGMVHALGVRRVSRRSAAGVLLIGLVCSIASLAIVDRLVPVGNTAFRNTVAGRPTPKGPNELTLAELRRELAAVRTGWTSIGHQPPSARRYVQALSVSYHTRIASSCGAFLLALLALATFDRGALARTSIGVLAWIAYVTYYIVVTGAAWREAWPLAPVTIAWLPNVVLGSVALGWAAFAWMATARRRLDPGR